GFIIVVCFSALLNSSFCGWFDRKLLLNRLQQSADFPIKSIGKYILSIAPLSALTNTPPEQKGGTTCRTTIAQCPGFSSPRGTRTLKGRLQHQNPYPSRRHGQTNAVCLNARTMQ
ncbi:hypothetical protein, partial [Chlorogloea sp. CCALA 695]|uniref:hypothetical protein n=1 Tax=Chlorogloea sp. CCALA 695 TaxID=2107693 RepID=UPI003513D95B